MTPEEYIKAYTRGCSNELVGGGYHEWLTPENALAAVELAREGVKEPASEDLEEEIKRFYNFKDDAQITNNFNGLMKFAKHITQWHSERIVVNKILDSRIDNKDFEREVEQTIKAQDLLNMLPHTLIKYTAQHFINWQRKQMQLTWQDIQRIDKIAEQMVDEDEDGRLLTMSEEDYYKEVLARYVKQSEKP